MKRAWPVIQGVPAAGHVTTGGAWHPGKVDTCSRCTPDDRMLPDRRLSAHQLDLLFAADRKWRSGDELASRRRMPGPVEGLHRTAASLVRQGLLERLRLGGVIHYQLTDRGARRWNMEFRQR